MSTIVNTSRKVQFKAQASSLSFNGDVAEYMDPEEEKSQFQGRLFLGKNPIATTQLCNDPEVVEERLKDLYFSVAGKFAEIGMKHYGKERAAFNKGAFLGVGVVSFVCAGFIQFANTSLNDPVFFFLLGIVALIFSF